MSLEELVARLRKVEDPANFDAKAYGAAFGGFIALTAQAGYTPEQTAAAAPKLSIVDNAEFFAGHNLRNCGKEFPVPGLQSGGAGWIIEAKDRSKDDPVMVYCHGGAYMLGIFPLMVKLMLELHNEVGNDRLSFLFLDYTLSNSGKYPTQLDELSRTLNTLSESCSKIIVGGDSAGGHLCISGFKHSLSPIAGATPLKPEAKPYATLLISPWVNLAPSEEGSYSKFNGIDILTAPRLYNWGKMFSSEFESPDLNYHIDTETDWEEALPEKENVYVYYGDHEVLSDDIVTWAKDRALLGEGSVNADVGGIHDGITFFLRDREEAFASMSGWLKEVIK